MAGARSRGPGAPGPRTGFYAGLVRHLWSGLVPLSGTLGRALRLDRARTLRAAATGSLAINVVLVVTGGAVRLTGSGLGCVTWPRCTDDSYVTTPAMGYHGVIEFGNRTITWVAAVLAVATVVAALCQPVRDRRRLWWAVAVLGGIPAQAVIGGITVLTDLNPWVVACHFLASMLVIAAAYRCWLACRAPGRRDAAVAGDPVAARDPAVPTPLRALAWLLTAASAAVLAVGTIVTGSGPHAGDEHAHRTGLDPGMVAQLHADLVMLLIGLTVALWFALRAATAPAAATRAVGWLFLVELAQGAVGFTQYFTHLPVLLVELHMAGAAAVWLATLVALAALTGGRAARPAPDPRQRQAESPPLARVGD